MEVKEFREYGKAMVDYIADYWESLPQRNPHSQKSSGVKSGDRGGHAISCNAICKNLLSIHHLQDAAFEQAVGDMDASCTFEDIAEQRIGSDAYFLTTYVYWWWDYFQHPAVTVPPAATNPLPSIKPGDIAKLLPSEAPTKGEDWKHIMEDLDNIILPGLTHWQSPNFHAYFPCGHSFPSILGDFISSGFGSVIFNWMSCPAGTELESVVTNWLGKSIGLPEQFLKTDNGTGGGVMHGSSSESIMIAILAAGEKVYNSHHEIAKRMLRDKLVAYTSDQGNACIEKVGKITSVPVKQVKSISGQLCGDALRKAICKDKMDGLIPCIVIATLGTTGICAYDNLEEIGRVCNEENVWLHVDAAYAGSAMICPEYRSYMRGIELCDSINVSPHKWMLVNLDCTAMWVKNVRYVFESVGVKRIYLDHAYSGYERDYHNWQLPLGRKIRSIKLWFVMRSYGIEGIQKYIRYHVFLANYFKSLVTADPRFEVYSSNMGVVCFRFNESNSLTQLLFTRMSKNKKYYFLPYTIDNTFVIRFAVCSRMTNVRDIQNAWNNIVSYADELLKNKFENGPLLNSI